MKCVLYPFKHKGVDIERKYIGKRDTYKKERVTPPPELLSCKVCHIRKYTPATNIEIQYLKVVLKNIFLSFLLTTFITIHNKSKIAEIFTQASKESEIPSPSIEGLNISRGTKPNVVI